MNRPRAASRVSTVLVRLGSLLAVGLGASASASSGDDLLASSGCAACHADLAPVGQHAAPELQLVVTHTRPGFLEAFLAAPHAVQPGTRMPDLLAGASPAEREAAAAALAAFLRSRARPGDEAERTAGNPARGERLFHEVGCVMCHGPRVPSPNSDQVPSPPAAAPGLDHVDAKYTAGGLAAFLFQPLVHRPGGLMPDMQLSGDEARDLAAYLVPTGRASTPVSPSTADAALVADGRRRFQALGCASCHAGVDDGAPDGEAAKAPPALGKEGGCLAKSPPPGAPDYRFDDAQRASLVTAMRSLPLTRSSNEILEHSLGAFRCTACHERGGAGGVAQALDDYLTTSEPDLGDHARRPPRLDGVGGKLRAEWLERVVYDGASVRPYMATRMPVFGEANVAHLPALFEELDAEAPLTFPRAEGDADREAREAARELLGTKSLGCVTCHVFNTKPAPSFQGLDLITSPERLRERWFRDVLVSPQSRLPGVVMPESWPGGVAVHDTLLGGDTDRQIAALWHFLTLGRTAPDPAGISQPRWNIDVGERPRVYRGRSRVAGFRGIALGFPEGLHVAFDAQNGALAALWRGDFVSVNWNGQGAGDFNPRSRSVELSRDLALVERDRAAGPWPPRPRTTKEEPVNPDPTYPRQLGYRFRGYRLDADGHPSLRYDLHQLNVEDRFRPAQREARVVLERTLRLETKVPREVSFRALTGEIERLADGRFRAGRLVLSVPDVPTRLRPSADGRELLLDVDLLPGRTDLELIYDLVD